MVRRKQRLSPKGCRLRQERRPFLVGSYLFLRCHHGRDCAGHRPDAVLTAPRRSTVCAALMRLSRNSLVPLWKAATVMLCWQRLRA